MFYFNTNKSQSIFFWQNTSCIRKLQVIFWGGGANPLHPPPRSTPVFNATYRTGLHGNYDYGLWNSRYNISTGHAHSILIFEKRRNCFWKPVNFDHKCDWQLNKRMCQSLVEVSILPHFFSHCDRPLLETSLTQRFPNSNSFLNQCITFTLNTRASRFVYFIQQEIESLISK